MEKVNAIGRRKAAVARVYLTEGSGNIVIDGKPLDVYFPSSILQYIVKQPLNTLEAAEKYDIKAHLDGGGYKGQAEALRLAIARALVSKPAIVLADEPTGNLDSRTSADVLGLLQRTSREFNQTLVMITHNDAIAQLADRIVRIEDGKIVG